MDLVINLRVICSKNTFHLVNVPVRVRASHKSLSLGAGDGVVFWKFQGAIDDAKTDHA